MSETVGWAARPHLAACAPARIGLPRRAAARPQSCCPSAHLQRSFPPPPSSRPPPAPPPNRSGPFLRVQVKAAGHRGGECAGGRVTFICFFFLGGGGDLLAQHSGAEFAGCQRGKLRAAAPGHATPQSGWGGSKLRAAAPGHATWRSGALLAELHARPPPPLCCHCRRSMPTFTAAPGSCSGCCPSSGAPAGSAGVSRRCTMREPPPRPALATPCRGCGGGGGGAAHEPCPPTSPVRLTQPHLALAHAPTPRPQQADGAADGCEGRAGRHCGHRELRRHGVWGGGWVGGVGCGWVWGGLLFF